MGIEIRLSDKVLPEFHNSWKQAERKTFNVENGGRASGKSSYIAEKIITIMMRDPVNAVVIRKVANTLHDSVREQLIWAIHELGVQDYWEYSQVSQGAPALTYKGFNNKIIFRGADDPMKIKSLASSEHPFAILWIEEIAEFRTEEEVDIIVDSIMREEIKSKYYIFYSYNPPKQKAHWLNKKYNTIYIPEDTHVHKSNYTHNKYLSSQYLARIKEMQVRNELKYRWMYLGEAIGGGIVPFSNLVFRKIDKEEIERFDNIKEGLDWGYANDPLAWVKMHYDVTRRILYIYDEVYGVKIGNRQFVEKVSNRHSSMIIADSAEPKSIDECRDMGLNIVGAKKGPGSIEHGEKWLDELESIIIDHERCPNTAKEFESIDYKIDRLGNTTNKLMDKDNHTIDATRYACEDFMYEVMQVIAKTPTTRDMFYGRTKNEEVTVWDL